MVSRKRAGPDDFNAKLIKLFLGSDQDLLIYFYIAVVDGGDKCGR